MLIYSYINTRGNWKNSKLCENTPPFGRRVSTQFLVFPISTRVNITVYQHGKCFIFLKYRLPIQGMGRGGRGHIRVRGGGGQYRPKYIDSLYICARIIYYCKTFDPIFISGNS